VATDTSAELLVSPPVSDLSSSDATDWLVSTKTLETARLDGDATGGSVASVDMVVDREVGLEDRYSKKELEGRGVRYK
jgi:hypothetical protein